MSEWYRNGGDEVWGTVKEPYFKWYTIKCLMWHYMKTGKIKDHHVQWINRCYRYYYEISPRVIARRAAWKEKYGDDVS